MFFLFGVRLLTFGTITCIDKAIDFPYVEESFVVIVGFVKWWELLVRLHYRFVLVSLMLKQRYIGLWC